VIANSRQLLEVSASRLEFRTIPGDCSGAVATVTLVRDICPFGQQLRQPIQTEVIHATLKIRNQEIVTLLGGANPSFPKYTTQIMNLANSNAQGTRPRVVGQMSELVNECEGATLQEWAKWYVQRMPGTIDDATKKVYDMVQQIRNAASLINENMVREWVTDLVLTKTFAGIRFQKAILAALAKQLGKEYRLADPAEESRGIDGFIGSTPVSIKPHTYKAKSKVLPEDLDVRIAYYEKRKDGITIEFEM
jgi:hypothetical protein